MRKVILHTLLVLSTLALSVSALHAKGANAAVRMNDLIWANGEIYDTILTQKFFDKIPPEQTTDILFNFAESGLSGQRPISDAAPGDNNYNGGRWAVHMVTFTPAGLAAHDPDGDGVVNFEIKSAAMVYHHAMVLGHLEITPVDVYFSCPLVK